MVAAIREAEARVLDLDVPDTFEANIENGPDYLWKAYGHAGIRVAEESGHPELAEEIAAIHAKWEAAHPTPEPDPDYEGLEPEPDNVVPITRPLATPFHKPETFEPSYQIRKKRRPGRNEPRTIFT